MKKNYKLIRLCIFVMAVLCVLSAHAQGQTITGRVLAEDAPDGLPGVTILIKGTTKGTTTDIEGRFKIAAGPADVLTFSFVGYKPAEVTVGNSSTLNITMDFDQQALQEVVVVGYGEQNRRDVTGSVVSIKEEQLEQTTPVNVLDGMQGRMSGVSITTNGGPGETSDIVIRGTSTLNGGTGPLYVVDGQQMEDISNLNPSDVASIEVLKDGASAAIYGSKSANGVVIITTKTGKAGKTKVDVSYIRSYNKLYTKIPVANTRQQRINELYHRNQASGANASPADSLSFKYNMDIDIQDILTRVGVKDQLNLALSGGSDNAKFYWNTGYITQQGVVLGSDYERINSTLNVNFNLGKKFTAGTRLMTSYDKREGLSEGGVFRHMAERMPWMPLIDWDGTYYPELFGRKNSLAIAEFAEITTRRYIGQTFNFLEYKILPSLSFKTTLGANFDLETYNEFNPTIVQRAGLAASGAERNTVSFDYQFENYFSWKKSFNNHNLNALLGMQIQEWNVRHNRFQSNDFNNDLVKTFDNVNELNISNTYTNGYGHSLSSQYMRATYNFKSKYLFATTLRRDGSSRFGTDNQYGLFPSASAGWRVSDEGFMQPLANVLTDLKFRVGVAVTGNERIGNYESRALYAPGNMYNGVNGIAPSQLANPDLLWESTRQINYGMDLALFGGKISATLDFYEKLTSDLLYNRDLPQETGFSNVRSNIGSIQNRGLEVFISASPMKIGALEWFTSFNISTNSNKIIDLAEEDGRFLSSDELYLYEEGAAIGNFYGFVSEGIFAYDESNAFDDQGQHLTPVFNGEGAFLNYILNGQTYGGPVNQLSYQGTTLKGGDVFWRDLNGDFKIDEANDRTVIGNGVPKFFGGLFNEFKVKDFRFSFLFDFNFGNDIYQNYEYTRNNRTTWTVTPGPERIEEAWYKPGDVARYPRIGSYAQNNLSANSFYVSDADFIKLRNVRLDYSLPESLLTKTNFIRNASVYFSANNLLTWTNYTGYNPELGSRGNALTPGLDNLRYPNYQEFILGLSMGF
ncbi:SusC/RagA family TonB-linked outer membrane protein [Echinicola pacifica]|uniref:SusC/RagA family TonB-linked outer membrane protein n=1 Tax=Echinicola pacifica TaxID=346377 RepID=A0A918UPK4_9BACT|nr:TonB-dependent receptor [Echinicola pacifica]GGZ25251.1 SusC/RagA family TonB-linked outer membrane protein [Echinicola pacifica]